eukprot:760714-Hanusia_phi.AAC.9
MLLLRLRSCRRDRPVLNRLVAQRGPPSVPVLSDLIRGTSGPESAPALSFLLASRFFAPASLPLLSSPHIFSLVFPPHLSLLHLLLYVYFQNRQYLREVLGVRRELSVSCDFNRCPVPEPYADQS